MAEKRHEYQTGSKNKQYGPYFLKKDQNYVPEKIISQFDGINMMQGYNFIMGLFTMGNVIAFPAEHFQTCFALILFQFLSRLPQAMVFGFVGFEFLDVEKDFGTL